LVSVIAIALLASISGFEGYDQFEVFAGHRYKWLREFLDLPPGEGPSDDTFSRVFASLPPREFADCLFAWLRDLVGSVTGKTIALDGKALRRSFDRAKELSPLHLVHAWVVEDGVLIGVEVTDVKSNEITAVAKLLERLDISGAVVTSDAMGCQKSHTQQITDGGAHYIITVKNNQPTLYAAIEAAFAQEHGPDVAPVTETFEHNHGRVEHRSVTVLKAPRGITKTGEWVGLKSIVRVERTRVQGDTETREVHFYITSMSVKRLARIARAIRAHWSVENTLHWSLDMTFREDESRVRQRNAAENLAVVRRLALTLIKRDTSKKTSMRIKRMVAAMDPTYALHVLLAPPAAEPQAKS
jgi:predicted transposase YbfD/YdcC